jgi:formylglycine-generating enzyme required for sulfatase activity
MKTPVTVLAAFLVVAAFSSGGLSRAAEEKGTGKETIPVRPEHAALAAKAAPLPRSPQQGDRWLEPVTGIEFIYAPEGCYTRGAPPEEEGRDKDESPAHKVCVHGFWLARDVVTNAQYRLFAPRHNSGEFDGVPLDGDDYPVVYVSWKEALAYTLWLTEVYGKRCGFWLPSESEWEYACRAGTATARFWGESPELQCEYANGADLSAKRRWAAWDVANCLDGYEATSPVGAFKPNPWGFRDMLGNVWQWCTDWKGKYPAARLWDPTGPLLSNFGRVTRGGSWDNDPAGLRCGNRSYGTDSFRRHNMGFRVGVTDLGKK